MSLSFGLPVNVNNPIYPTYPSRYCNEILHKILHVDSVSSTDILNVHQVSLINTF